MPVLPPTDASTIANSVVGMLMKSMPRLNVLAAKPPRSVGHHSASEIYHQRVACGSTVAQCLPHLCQCVEVLVCVGGFDDYRGAVFQCLEVLYFWPAQLLCRFVGEYEYTVVFTF